MNRSGKYSRKFDIRGSAGTHIPQMLTADCNWIEEFFEVPIAFHILLLLRLPEIYVN
ncbi:hypothetical protein T11_8041 [Trichinella zimbabwensis]|uniref:Uncharacterized protein n=1 Tax=Trichinella zimbabwensis TaxID=268475 RepID=A0A0V1GKG7_9BILA|nr:hypothetical protein T11_8041 [Trichinella zimbabwensis]